MNNHSIKRWVRMWTMDLMGHSSRNTAVWTEGEREGAEGRQAEELLRSYRLWILTFHQIHLFPFSRQTLCFIDSSLHCAKVFLFAVIHLFIFVFVSFAWGDISKRAFLRQMSVKEGTALFSSRSCMVSDLTFKSFNNIK